MYYTYILFRDFEKHPEVNEKCREDIIRLFVTSVLSMSDVKHL